MKFLIIIFFTVFPILSYGQYDFPFLQEFFFGRQSNARSEAMGRGYSSIDGDLGCINSNPAGIATINKVEFNISRTSPNFYLSKGFSTFYGAGYKINKYLKLALSQFRFDYGNTIFINSNTKPFEETNTFTISSEPIKNLLVGLNTNYLVWQPGTGKISTSVYFDFGLIKKIPICVMRKNKHNINIGASISNFNFSKTSAIFSGIKTEYSLPVITRYGVSYEYKHGKCFFIDTVNIFNLLFQCEYQKLLNSKYRSGIKVGGEVTILNLLSIRAGYFKEKTYNYGYPDENKSEINGFTYGAGILIPLMSLTKLPVNINFDYTSLPQVSYIKRRSDYGIFRSYSFRANILLNSKKNKT